MGPVVQHSGLKHPERAEIRVYAVPMANSPSMKTKSQLQLRNGSFTIGFIWDDAQKELTIGHREGAFKGVLSERKFKLVYFTDELNKENAVMRIVDYSGERMGIKL